MIQHAVNIAGDKEEFHPQRWNTVTGQNGVATQVQLPKRRAQTGIDILIVGAGMGGLMTALECWRKGHNIVGILERNEGPVYSGTQLKNVCVYRAGECVADFS